MIRPLFCAGLLIALGCSRQPALNYRHCLKLRVGMTREQVFAIMGPPEETFPYVEGRSLPHLQGRTAYEWSTPAQMSAPNRVSIDDVSGKAESIRCGDSNVTAAVYVEPPEPAVSTTIVYGVQPVKIPPSVTPSSPRRGPRERSSSSLQSSGRPLTD